MVLILVLGQTAIFALGTYLSSQRDKTLLRSLFSSKAQFVTKSIGTTIGALYCQEKVDQIRNTLDKLRGEQDFEFARFTSSEDKIIASIEPPQFKALSHIDPLEQSALFEEKQIFATFVEISGCGTGDSAGELILGYSFKDLNSSLHHQVLSQVHLFLTQMLMMIALVYIMMGVLNRYFERIVVRAKRIITGDLKEVHLFKEGSEFSTMQDTLNALCNTLAKLQKENERQRFHLVSSSKLTALGEMTIGIANQIRNPISIIAGRTQQVKKVAQLTAVDKNVIVRHSQAILEQTDELMKIIEGLDSFSSNGPLQFQSVRVKSLIDEALFLTESRFLAQKIVVQVGLADPALRIECRPNEITQIIVALINNAFEAMAEVSEKWVQIEVIETRDLVSIAIVDNGPGISKDVRENIMKPFYSTKDKGKGFGLSLSTALDVAHAHHGVLVLDDQAKNTRFVLELPKSQPVQWGFSGVVARSRSRSTTRSQKGQKQLKRSA